MWNHHYMGYGGFMMWIGLILLIVVIVILFKNTGILEGSSNRKNTSDKSPLDILKERYARGEINEDEYERMKKNL